MVTDAEHEFILLLAWAALSFPHSYPCEESRQNYFLEPIEVVPFRPWITDLGKTKDTVVHVPIILHLFVVVGWQKGRYLLQL